MIIVAPIARIPADMQPPPDRIAWPQLRKALRRQEVMHAVAACPGGSRHDIAAHAGQSVAQTVRHLEALIEQRRVRAVRVDREINYYPGAS